MKKNLAKLNIIKFFIFALTLKACTSTIITLKDNTKRALNGLNSIQEIDCGKSKIPPSINGQNLNRIINGDEAVPHSWPWMISLQQFNDGKYEHICGGSLVSERFVITAAHCLHNRKITNIVAVIGVHNNNIELSDGNLFYIEEVFFYDNFDNQANNIAVAKLSKKVTLSDKVQILCLPPSSNISMIYNKFAVMIGWGFTENQKPSNVLNQAKTKIITDISKCDGHDKDHYCVLDPSDRKSNICFRDGGSPLMYFMNGRWYLYGIASFGSLDPNDFCDNKKPGFYVTVPKFKAWIEFNIKVVPALPPVGPIIIDIKRPNNLKCGEQANAPIESSRFISRILNGEEANENSWPWVVSIRHKQNSKFVHYCSGTLIDLEYVLTLASCIVDNYLSDTYIAIGYNDLNEKFSINDLFKISKVIRHFNYDPVKRLDNIALIKLSRKVYLSNNVQLVCLPPSSDLINVYKKELVFVGWGSTTGASDSVSNKLLETTVKIRNWDNYTKCQNYQAFYYCGVDARNKGSIPCYYDLGGGLYYKINKKWYLYGLFSGVNKLDELKRCNADSVSLFERVPNYFFWIYRNLK